MRLFSSKYGAQPAPVATHWICLLAAVFSAGLACAQGDMEVLKQRVVEYRTNVQGTTPDHPVAIEEGVDQHLATQQADGSWADITYGDTSTAGGWSPVGHLVRLESMATAIRQSANPYFQSQAMIDAVLRGLDYWFTRKPVCNDNSWQMGIGRNLYMKTIVLLMEPYLSAGQKASALGELFYFIADLDNNGVYEYYYPNKPTLATGQNKQWVADIHLNAALLKNSSSEVSAAAAALRGLVTITSGEGINADYSFLQHGLQLNSGSYGKSFFYGAARHAYLFQDLASYKFSESEMSVLRNLALDGIQWMTRRGVWDPLVVGRAIVRQGNTLLGVEHERAILDLQVADPANAAKYQAYVDQIGGTNDANLIGNKHFWRADYSVHRRAGYSFHIRSSSTRTIIQETGNDENIQNSYESQGATMLILDGGEYAGMFGCLRYDQFPGVTAPEKNPAPRTANWEVPGTRTFVGGVSNGTHGVSAKDLSWDGVTGKKSWFCFDDDIVGLGAGITYSGGRAVRTTINQSAGRSDVHVEFGAGSGTIAAIGPDQILSDPKWVYHDNVGYVFPASSPVELKNEKGVVADWNDVSPGAYPKGTLDTQDRFTLMVPHGVNPTNATYAYVLVPGKSKDFVRAYAAAPQSRILANSPAVQAVRNDSRQVAGVVFWSPGQVTLTPELSISVDTDCMVLVDESGPVTRVSVSRHAAATVNVTLDYASSADRTLIFQLPGGSSAGISQTQTHVATDLPGTLIEPVADTYVRDGTFAGQNFGSETTLLVKNETTSYRRQAFLKFDLGGITQPVLSAKLHMTVLSTGSPTTVEVNRVQGDTWTESGMTWNNRPTAGLTYLGSFVAQNAGEVIEIDLTDAVISELAGDKVLSLRLSTNQAGQFFICSIGSRENPAADHRTTLSIATQPGVSYSQWAAEHFAGGVNHPSAGGQLDPDQDGLVNLMEYATGSDPWAASPSPQQFAVVSSGAAMEFRFHRSAEAAPYVNFRCMVSDDLGEWNAVWEEALDPNYESPLVSSGDPEQDGWITLRIPIPPGTDAQFLKLEVVAD